MEGALVNALEAIALGAPVGIHGNKLAAFEFCQTSFVLSYYILLLFYLAYWQFVPAASVYGSSWEDWRRIFAHTNFVSAKWICLPVHGAVIGAWFGAWPMPLDWERPWQEWPICVSYGALAEYLIGMVASLGFVLIRGRQHHQKGD
ncbi:phosphatidylinositol-glycan biosynthesis class F protein-like [Pistacia vera]|uniref:phosphatidylinositol-glycan biosynthesis class F protein-like n=1 Tax=Pistacia vera TaxID=55513 RepID=UPI001262CD1A|nr:phosphatidylinositol-glycan biosynthesis class F protein-like [Pistacia vera]